MNKVLHKYKLIIAANRDEFMDREASPLHIWNDANDIVAGKDKKEGGTWMGWCFLHSLPKSPKLLSSFLL